jgi:SAM-dependent methyltransferase
VERDDLDPLLAEQISYYRARGPDVATAARAELIAALDAFAPVGHVLELACGPGTWTAELLRHAGSVTALDASPEMLAIAADSVRDPRVTFARADLFAWTPAARYDNVFFGFWISHVPLERFASFWSMVARALKPGGRVMFVDDDYRTDDELIEGPESSTILRRLEDGTPFRAVKVPHSPEELTLRLAGLGWRFEVQRTSGPFFWGVGAPT